MDLINGEDAEPDQMGDSQKQESAYFLLLTTSQMLLDKTRGIQRASRKQRSMAKNAHIRS